MKRLGHLVIGLVLATAAGTGAVQAQTVNAGKWTAQVDGAVTLGHSSSSSFGGELDRHVGNAWELFLEAGHMRNVTTRPLQDRAAIIADAIGGTANPVQTATYYDVGLRYHLMPEGKWNPYVAVGFGAARANTATTFTVNGAQLTDSQLVDNYNVSLGLDLSGYVTKPFLLVGAGVTLPLRSRYFLDGSVRYGRIFPRSGVIDGDTAVNTVRVQIGLGIRF
jgi:opacity protein-like surface antigen